MSGPSDSFLKELYLGMKGILFWLHKIQDLKAKKLSRSIQAKRMGMEFICILRPNDKNRYQVFYFMLTLCQALYSAVCMLSHDQLLVTLWTIAQQAPPGRRTFPGKWNFPGKNTQVGCHFLCQGIFPTQGSNQSLLHLLHWQVDSLLLWHLGSQNSGLAEYL